MESEAGSPAPVRDGQLNVLEQVMFLLACSSWLTYVMHAELHQVKDARSQKLL